MSNKPHYNYPPPQGNYPPPGNYTPPPPPGGYQGGGLPPGRPPGKTQQLGLDYNLAALLCYLPLCSINIIFSIIWLVTEPKQNRFLRFHALQGLLLSGAAIVLYIVLQVLGGIMVAASPFRGAGWSILALLQGAIGLGILALSIIGMIKAYNNEMWKIPVIGDIAEKNS
jgi:uncharacterized membrane protein